MNRKANVARVENGGAALTAQQIADVLNRRHGTSRNNAKNVAAVLHEAEKKLRKRLASDPAVIELFGRLAS